MHRHLIESVYSEAMVLADEMRHYCEHQSPIDAAHLDPMTGVLLSCESLRLTTRLMHLLAWLLGHRAWAAGEVDSGPGRLPALPETSDSVRLRLPDAARALIAIGEALYRRAGALDVAMIAGPRPASPARALQQRLAVDLRG
ncbi:hypothetical protein GCM10011380_23270 [Sphingomonas metalli]|uniref:DUF1465 family protein n=2 Tax=Sphingomonas metalli TaxID=1779358 RepID=A0A916WVF3_9SPHN|nr:hypothetical protein GCM10011380_23270 [Sphingomonas metalli]